MKNEIAIETDCDNCGCSLDIEQAHSCDNCGATLCPECICDECEEL